MFDVGGGELLLIFVAVLLLFGPKKIPEVMRSVGKGLRQFRQAQEDLKQQMRDLSADVEKMTAVEEPVKVIPTPVKVIPTPVNLDSSGPEVPARENSQEVEQQMPTSEEQHQQTITPKPAEATVSRNPHTVKKVFDDTVYDD